MKKFILLCFGLLVAGVAAFAVPQDLKKDFKKDYQIEIRMDMVKAVVSARTIEFSVISETNQQEIFIDRPYIHTKRTGIEKPMARYLRTWYSFQIKSTDKDLRPGIDNSLMLARRYC